jgi:transposase
LDLSQWQARKKDGDNTKKNFGKAIGDFAPAFFLKKLEQKFDEYYEVPTRDLKPSRHCPKCGEHKMDKDYDHTVTIFVCDNCGFTCNRDVLANINLQGVDVSTNKYNSDMLFRALSKVDTSSTHSSDF